jgi:tRNA A-37 threonylcarbamoyl transferase component Bud32
MKNDDKNTLGNSTLWNSTVIATYSSLNIESPILDAIVDWAEHTLMLPVDPRTNLKQYISERIENEKINKSQVIQFMKEADFCVSDLVFKKAILGEHELELVDKLKEADEPVAKDFLDRLLNKKDLYFTHTVDGNNYDLKYKEESMGTKILSIKWIIRFCDITK